MKIGILTAMWRRPEIFRIFAEGVNRLREEFDIVPVAVGSEKEKSMKLCREYEFLYLERPNKPLSKKFNEGLEVFRTYPVDYVVVLGSDDLISNSFLRAYMPHMERGEDLIGVLDIYFYEIGKGRLSYWSGYGDKKENKHRQGEPLGMGRAINIDLIKRMKYRLWPENIDRSLDWHMWQRLRRIKPVTMRMKDEDIFGVDVKSRVNITNSILYNTSDEDSNIMKKYLSEREIQMIYEAVL